MSQKLGVAVYGYGRMGAIHAKNAYENPRTHLLYVVARNKTKAQALASKFHGVQGITPEEAEEKVYKSKDVQAVIIASATPTHHAIILKAFDHGKAVFCDKPIALKNEEIVEAFERSTKVGLPLLCGYNRRFDPHFLRVKNQIITDAIGHIKFMRITSRDHPPPPLEFLDSAGSFFDDFSTHDVDMARWLTGESPSSIYACATNNLSAFKGKGADDTAILVLTFPSGVICVIDNSRRTTYGYDQRCEILGTKGMLTVENPVTSTVKFYGLNGEESSGLEYSFPERYEQAYNNELNHFLDLVQGKEKTPIVNVTDCLKAAEITQQAQKSRDTQLEGVSAVKNPKITDAVKPLVSSPTVNFCVCGIGRMGQIRASSIIKNPNSKLLYAFDVDAGRLDQFAKDYGCKAVKSLDEALADPNLHAVVISTFSPTHHEMILKCIAAKKMVFCEKPLTLSTKDTDECCDAADKAGVYIYCAFQRRSDPEFATAKKHVDAGKIGQKIELLRITSRDAASHNTMGYLQNSGGYFYDSLIHDFDMAQYFIGEAPSEIYCVGSSFIPDLKAHGDIDSVAVVLRFPSGSIATIDNNRSAVYGYDQRLEVFGEKGMIQVGNRLNTVDILGNEKGFIAENTQPGMTRYATAYENEINHFINVLLGKEAKKVSHNDCKLNARIADTAVKSFKSGKAQKLID